jgi:hypothetical protein
LSDPILESKNNIKRKTITINWSNIWRHQNL